MRLTDLARALALTATLLLPAAAATAAPATVVLDGFVTSSSDPSYETGDPVQLEILYSDDFVAWFAGGPGSGDLAAALSATTPLASADGTWSNARFVFFDIRTGQEIPPFPPPPPDRPFLSTRLETAFEVGGPDEQLIFDGVVGPLLPEETAALDGTIFRERFRGGTVELRRGDATVLTATLIPEPSTALLLGGGLLGLAAVRRARRD